MTTIEAIVSRIIDGIAEEGLNWLRPWRNAAGCIERATNASTGNPYRGANQFWLSMVTREKGHSTNQWVTYKQAQALGGNVRKGEKSTACIMWKQCWAVKSKEGVTYFKLNEKKKADALAAQNGGIVTKTLSPFPFRVFNVAQCDGLNVEAPVADTPGLDFKPIEAAEAAVAAWADAPRLVHGGNRAYYSPLTDHVQMPERHQFRSGEGYYQTLFHELVHSTGHESRLNRFSGDERIAAFGDQNYSREELVAEVGAATISARLGIQCEATEANTNAYVKHWADAIREDNVKAIWGCLGKADKAVTMILGD